MTPTKDTENRVVVHLPIWMRVLGGIGSLGFGALSYGLAQGIGEDTTSLVLFICVGLPLTFLCIYFLGYTSQFIFDHTSGNMTIRMGVGPFTYRSRTFSKKEVQYCVVSTSEAPATYQSPSITLWQVELRISGRKKDLKTTVNNKERANYLAARINAFRGSG